MNAKDLLNVGGFLRQDDGKYTSPDYYKGKRTLSKDDALERIVRGYGYESYRQYQNTTRTTEYRKFKDWFEQVQGDDIGFDSLYGKARRKGLKPKSKDLIELLRATTFQNGSDGTWYHGLAWDEYGFGKWHKGHPYGKSKE